MIVGTGIDILKVERIKTAMNRTPGFEETVFAPEEIAYCQSKARAAEHFAARFAAKEAVMKALGTGWSGGIRFRDIVVLNHENGRPYIEIREPTRSLIPEFSNLKIWISLSHDTDTAVAHAVLESISVTVDK